MNAAKQSFKKAVQLMIMCHQTKFGSKGIRSLEVITETNFDYDLNCDLDPEDCKPYFSHDTAFHDHVPPYRFGYKRLSSSEGIFFYLPELHLFQIKHFRHKGI